MRINEDVNKPGWMPATYVEGWSEHDSVQSIPYRRLGNTDMFVSVVSLGGAHVGRGVSIQKNGGLLGAARSVGAIREAIRLGINLVDTSPYYGMGISEIVLGEALKGVPRQAYYLATKTGRRSDCTFDFTAAAIEHSVTESLRKLGVTYIDLIQIHDVEFGDLEVILHQALPTLQRFRESGKVRYIGITGYPLSVLRNIVERSEVHIDCILTYCRYSLWDDELLHYLPFFKERQIGVINAALLGMGIFAEQVPHWHPAPLEIRDTCRKARQLCEELGVHISQIAFRHALAETRIDTHLVGMETVEMVRQNIATVNAEASQQEHDTFQQILETFSKLTVHHWENIEIERYLKDPEEFRRFLIGEK